jgi:hypothetical protein
MKYKTKKEVEKFIEKLWPNEGVHREVMFFKGKEVAIRLSSMYSPPGLHFSQLMKISKFFDSKNLDEVEHFSNEGCPTCDYGSSYGFTLTIRPDNEETDVNE